MRRAKLERIVQREIHVHSPRFFSLLRAVLSGGLLLACGLGAAHPLHDSKPLGALYLNNRYIATFRSTLLGDSPADRVQLASAALAEALQNPTPSAASVTHSAAGDAVRFEVNGRTVFLLVAADAGTPRPEAALLAQTRQVQQQLEKAVGEAAELRDRLRIAADFAICLGASRAAWLLVLGILRLHRHLASRIHAALHRPSSAGHSARFVNAFSEYAHVACRLLTNAVAWSAVVLIVDAWITFVLLRFAWTRPWGELSSHWLLEVLRHFASATAAAVPGLVVAVLIFVIARMVAKANAAFMQRVESGDIQLAWLDAHTALPTRRLCDAVVWMFALAMAYPYLPGAETEAFKALSVMTGLMLSLGASSAVGQAFAGMTLMYSRSLRVGQRVKIGKTEGTVIALGMFTTRVRTEQGEEVCLPNKRIFRTPVRHLPPPAPASTPAREPPQLP